jgi:hypothetical protein
MAGPGIDGHDEGGRATYQYDTTGVGSIECQPLLLLYADLCSFGPPSRVDLALLIETGRGEVKLQKGNANLCKAAKDELARHVDISQLSLSTRTKSLAYLFQNRHTCGNRQRAMGRRL